MFTPTLATLVSSETCTQVLEAFLGVDTRQFTNAIWVLIKPVTIHSVNSI
jgi:hypothetical protein